jgi:hypothetical protein
MKLSKPILLFAFILSLGFMACSSISNETELVRESDLDMAAEIMGSAISDEESGIVNSIYDAFSTVSATGISYGKGSIFNTKNIHDDSKNYGGRGHERAFTHSYDSTTGVHTLSFERSFTKGPFTNSTSTLQEFVYTDLDGNFIARPKVNRDAINTISLASQKSGSIINPRRSSEFTKIDTMLFTGLHASESLVKLSGKHRSFGSGEAVLRDSSSYSRSFSVSITFDNITIDKDTVAAYGNLENGLTGTLTYSIVMNKVINGTPDESIMEGTVDLSEDGTALMQFYKYDYIYRLGLRKGDIKERGRRGKPLGK